MYSSEQSLDKHSTRPNPLVFPFGAEAQEQISRRCYLLYILSCGRGGSAVPQSTEDPLSQSKQRILNDIVRLGACLVGSRQCNDPAKIIEAIYCVTWGRDSHPREARAENLNKVIANAVVEAKLRETTIYHSSP
jgi:hypothetical protein